MARRAASAFHIRCHIIIFFVFIYMICFIMPRYTPLRHYDTISEWYMKIRFTPARCYFVTMFSIYGDIKIYAAMPRYSAIYAELFFLPPSTSLLRRYYYAAASFNISRHYYAAAIWRSLFWAPWYAFLWDMIYDIAASDMIFRFHMPAARHAIYDIIIYYISRFSFSRYYL